MFCPINCNQFCWRHVIPWDFTQLEQYGSNHTIIFRTVYLARVCQCHSCVGITLSDVSCKFEWNRRNNVKADRDKRHHGVSRLVECKKACEFDPRCVAVDWKTKSGPRHCEINTEPNHNQDSNDDWDHYDLVSRCNITLGECFNSNVVNKCEVSKKLI